MSLKKKVLILACDPLFMTSELIREYIISKDNNAILVVTNEKDIPEPTKPYEFKIKPYNEELVQPTIFKEPSKPIDAIRPKGKRGYKY